MKWSACQHHLASVHGEAQPQDLQELCKTHGQALPSYRVTVISASGEELKLQDVTSVGEVKVCIMKHWRISLERQTLVTSGRQCHDGGSLSNFVASEPESPLVMNLITSPIEFRQDVVGVLPHMPIQTPNIRPDDKMSSHSLPSALASRESDDRYFHSQPPEVCLTDREGDELLSLDEAELIGNSSYLSSASASPPVMCQGKIECGEDDFAMTPSEFAPWCQNGVDRVRAHRRPCQKLRGRINKMVEKIVEEYADDPSRLRSLASILSSRSGYITGLFVKHGLVPARARTEEVIPPEILERVMQLLKSFRVEEAIPFV